MPTVRKPQAAKWMAHPAPEKRDARPREKARKTGVATATDHGLP